VSKKKLVLRGIENGEKNADVCWEFGLVNSAIQTVWKNNQNIIALEQKGSRTKRLWKPEPSDVDEALLKWVKQQRSDSVAVSGPQYATVQTEIAERL
jgi:hypothetical protein